MASTDRLQSDHFNDWLQSLLTRYRLYSLASPEPVTESTHLVHSTVLILGQVDVGASPKNCFNQLVTESTDQVPFYTALILTPAYQFFDSYRELLVTEKTTIFYKLKKLAKYRPVAV